MEPPTGDSEVPVEINMISSALPATPAKLDEMHVYTSQDPVLRHLKDIGHHGWPEPNENDLVLKGHCLVIPSKIHPQMLHIVHQGHMGTKTWLLKAKDCLFCSGISRDIKKMTANCLTFMQFCKQQPKEPLYLTVYSVFPDGKSPPICSIIRVPSTFFGWLWQRVPDTEKTELCHIRLL